MPPQKVVAMGRKGNDDRRSRGSGHGGSHGGYTGASQQWKNPGTPRITTTGSTFQIKIKISNNSTRNPAYPSRARFDQDCKQQIGENQEEQYSPTVNREAQDRLSERVHLRRQGDVFIFGSELDGAVAFSSIGEAYSQKTEGGDEEFRGSPPSILQRERQPRGMSHVCRNEATPHSFRKVNDSTGFPTVNTVHTPSSYREDQQSSCTLPVSNMFMEVMKHLRGPGKVHINLPHLVDAENPDADMSYSGLLLMQLYLEAYNTSRYDFCDLIADTWIRAFHALRWRDERQGNGEEITWRPNEALTRRRAQGKRGFEDQVPQWSGELPIQDPEMDPGVTDFRVDLLDALYTGTKPDCGARFLWADAMALCGSKLETKMQIMKRRNEKWNPDLVYDIMCTGLRMARRKLTLKIEESTKGAWCKRYHEHTRHGLPCYRELASQGGGTSDEDGPEGVVAKLIDAELSRGEKRQLGDMKDGEVQIGEAKRVRIEDEHDGVIDVDAEGDSGDE